MNLYSTEHFCLRGFNNHEVYSLFFDIFRKYEEIYPPDVTEFVYITDDTYTKKQVLRMEQLVLGVLEFNVTVPTAFFFANHFSKVGTYMKSYLYEL